MTSETLATAAAVAALPAGGVGLIAALGTVAGERLRGPVALAVAVWCVLAPYMALVVLRT